MVLWSNLKTYKIFFSRGVLARKKKMIQYCFWQNLCRKMWRLDPWKWYKFMYYYVPKYETYMFFSL